MKSSRVKLRRVSSGKGSCGGIIRPRAVRPQPLAATHRRRRKTREREDRHRQRPEKYRPLQAQMRRQLQQNQRDEEDLHHRARFADRQAARSAAAPPEARQATPATIATSRPITSAVSQSGTAPTIVSAT